MCDGNQKSFCFVLQLRLFYMVHTFVSEVSLHSWLIWPTVWRAGAVYNYALERTYLINSGAARS